MTYAIYGTLLTQSKIRRLIYVTKYKRTFPHVGKQTENYPTTFSTWYVGR